VTRDAEGEVPLIAVCCDSDQSGTRARAEALALRLGVPQSSPDSHDTPLLLAVTDDRIEVRQTDSTSGPVYSEFAGGPFGYRKTLPLRRELLARAVGFKGQPLDVIDMTAGLGRDDMVLALLGCRVTAIESHPVVFELLEDGLRRARRNPDMARVIEQRLHLVRGDSVATLASLPPGARPDVVYLDPMFPARGQSALVKKEMVLLSRLVGSGEDAERLLRAALASGCHRVVIKRPRHSPPLVVPGGPPPTLHFEGRAARFDVYFPGSINT
jgi:16S rRNA (guanine1516-N2)-methyltransferase